MDNEAPHEAPVLVITTKAMVGNTLLDNEVVAQEEYSSDDVEPPHLSNLEKVASTVRRATKAIEGENDILHDRIIPNVIHDLDDSEMGQWEGPDIPFDEFDHVRKLRAEKTKGYDLWANLSLLKTDITFG